MVDAVIDSVIGSRRRLDRLIVHILVFAHVGGVLADEAVGQVDDLAHLSLLEQRGIALTVDLLHLPAHRRQHQHVLARRRVGSHLHALALYLHRGIVLVATLLVPEDLLALRAVGVQVVIDQP